MEDLFIALGVSFMLAFVVAGPRTRHAPETPPLAKAAKPAKK